MVALHNKTWDDDALVSAIVGLGSLDITMWGDNGSHFSCSEADAVADLLEAVGMREAAEYLMTGHYYTDTDEEEELENHGANDGARDPRIKPSLMWDEGTEPY